MTDTKRKASYIVRHPSSVIRHQLPVKLLPFIRQFMEKIIGAILLKVKVIGIGENTNWFVNNW